MADGDRGSRRGRGAAPGSRPDRTTRGRTTRASGGTGRGTGSGGASGSGRTGSSGSASSGSASGGAAGSRGSSGGGSGSGGAGSRGSGSGWARGGRAGASGAGASGFGRPGEGGRRPSKAAQARAAAQAARAAARAARPQSKARTREGTGGAFGMTGTRRAALLAMVVCALALSIAVPLRTYLAQREELREVTASQETLRAEVNRLEQRKHELADPAHLEAEARRRLHYVRPGETPYVVQLPGDAERKLEDERPATAPAADKAWYEQLWDSVAAR
ncbi:septum formation initiator family protein [Saccharothrix sp.]|uniref:FtsB family cell division protein n=1 Tax=Saccharothrix sp. TaxID=1873460 RepID=UPI002811C1DF|nr:septum formation initiator family protein [Saccharothrix sp.]